MSQIMLYKPGSMITCGPHSLDYIIVDDEEVKSHLKKGWVETATKQKVAKAEEDGENEG